MSEKVKAAEIDELVVHFNEHLPDSISQRRRLLETMIQILPVCYSHRHLLGRQLETIKLQERYQLELPEILRSEGGRQ